MPLESHIRPDGVIIIAEPILSRSGGMSNWEVRFRSRIPLLIRTSKTKASFVMQDFIPKDDCDRR